jgi:hypothetical protein
MEKSVSGNNIPPMDGFYFCNLTSNF